MVMEELPDHLVVFLRLEAAGAVNQCSARLQEHGRPPQQFALKRPQALDATPVVKKS